MNPLRLIHATALIILVLPAGEAWAQDSPWRSHLGVRPPVVTPSLVTSRAGTPAKKPEEMDVQIREKRLLAEFDDRIRSYIARRHHTGEPGGETDELCSVPDIPDSSVRRGISGPRRVFRQPETEPEELCSLPDVTPDGEGVSRHLDIATPRYEDIFTHDIEELFRGIIAQVLTPLDQASVLRAMPLFPAGAPVELVSPELFRTLPRLPDGLEYRSQRHDLAIVDLDAEVIVDSIWLVIGPSGT